MKITSVITLATIISFSASGYAETSVLTELKNTPLSTYAAGKNQLQSLTTIFNVASRLDKKGKKVPHFTVIEEANKLGVNIQGFEKAKKVTQEYCLESFNKYQALGISSDIPQIIWPSLSKEKAALVRNDLFIQITLVAEENNNFKVSCSKTLAEL